MGHFASNYFDARPVASCSAAQDQPLEVTDVTYKSEDGTVASKLYKLKDLRGRAPAILLLPGRGRDFSGMEWLIKPLAQNGYAVLAIGYRGFRSLLPHRRRGCEWHYPSRKPCVHRSGSDRNFGHSRGGMAALMTAASGDKRVRSVVSTSAPTDHFKSVEEKKFSAAHYPDRMRTRGTPPDEDPEYYRSISAIYHASKMRDVPIFLIHGAADFLCFVDHSLNMYGALKVAGNRQARLEVIPGAEFFERGFSGYVFDEVTKLVVPWFDDTLKGKRRTEN